MLRRSAEHNGALRRSAEHNGALRRSAEHNGALPPTWHEFGNSVKAEIRVLYSQQFTKSHLHFLIIVECDKMAATHLCAREYAENSG